MNHDDIENLRAQLPWAVNGTLSPAEQEEVTAWLSRDAAAAGEFAFLQRLAAEVKADVPDSIVSEFGWERLRRQLHAPAFTVSAPSASRLSTFWRGMGVAAVLVIAVQISWVWQLQRDNADLQYQLLSEPAPVSADQQWHFRLILVPEASVQDMVALLQSHHGTVFGGPSALGLFDVVVPATAETTPEQLLEQLQASDVVRHVEWTDAAQH